jgi:hypothetical protein
MRRRMAERWRRRAKAGEAEREGEENGAGELPHLDAKLRGGEKVDGKQWNGGDAKLREASTMAAARNLGFCEGGGCGFGFRISRGSRVPFIGAEREPWRAGPRGTRRGARDRVGL